MKGVGPYHNVSFMSTNELCLSCGACEAICPRNAIRLVEQRAILVPLVDLRKCNPNCSLCLKVCPGVTLFGIQIYQDPHLGIKDLYVGHSENDLIRRGGQAGGLVTGMLCQAIELGLVDGVVITRTSSTNPPRASTFLATSPEEVRCSSGSKYLPTPALRVLKEVKSSSCEKIAFVGLPCHLQGLKNLTDHNASLRRKIVLHIGLICDGTMNHNFQEFASTHAGCLSSEISSVVFRDKKRYGWPGQYLLKIHGADIPLPEGFRARYKKLFRPLRCRLCMDKLNSNADIVFGDPHHLPWDKSDLKRGLSLLAVRTENGQQFIDRLITQGTELRLYELNKDFLLKSQSPQIKPYKVYNGYLSVHKVFAGQPNNMKASQLDQFVKKGTVLRRIGIVAFGILGFCAARFFSHAGVARFFALGPAYRLLSLAMDLDRYMGRWIFKNVAFDRKTTMRVTSGGISKDK